MALKTLRARCHCGKVSIEADIDLMAGTGRCNCSICAKSRWWGISVKPAAVRAVQGEDYTLVYRFATQSIDLRFCSTCGLRVYGKGHIAQMGGDFVAINVACIEGVTDEELAAIPIHYSNGRDNDWMHTPKVISYL